MLHCNEAVAHMQMAKNKVQERTQISNDTPASQAGAMQPLAISPAEFFCMLGAYFFLRLPFVLLVPMGEAPDEYAHYWVIKFLREHMRLPDAAEVHAGGASAVYGSMPQLGYIPHVIATFCGSPESIASTERIGSVLMGAVMLYAAVNIGVILFPKNKPAALALPASVICHPQLVFIHSYANNDSTSSALASLILWLTLETVRKGLAFKRTLAIGALVGWLAISKYSGLAIIPVVGLALIASVFLHGTALNLAAVTFASAALIAVLVSSWWFWQNMQQYPGDPMGTKTMYKSWAQTFNRDMNYYLPPSHIIKSWRWWRMTFFSYWGMFGYMTIYLWRPLYISYFVLVLSAVLGWLNGLRTYWKQRPNPAQIIMWSSLALTLLLNIASMIWASVYNYGGPQGRYLVTSEIPIMALIIGGMSLLGRAGKWVILLFLLFNLVVCIGSWIYLYNLYGGLHLNPLV